MATNLVHSNKTPTQAVDTDDKLGVVMRYLRAAEAGSLATISTCLLRYTHITQLVRNPYQLNGNLAITLRGLRDHAVELAREHALELLLKAQKAEEEQNHFQASQEKKKGTRLLYKLAPGKGGSIGAIIDERGNFLTDLQAMVNLLRRHWSEIFKEKGVESEMLDNWLEEDAADRIDNRPDHSVLRNIKVRRRDLRRALKPSNNSAAGPDGIPYGAWRALGDSAVNVLYDAFSELILEEGRELLRRDYPGFNESLLFFCPKKR